jgi:hypothetical protein
MPEEIDRQAILDEEYLKLLSLGYMVSAGFAALFSVLGLFYMGMGIVMSFVFAHAPATTKGGEPPPAFIGWIFAAIGLVMFIILIGIAFARFWAARCLKQRKSRTYCMVIGALGCLEIPYGTLLGVLTFIVLGRDSVKQLFEPKTAPIASGQP